MNSSVSDRYFLDHSVLPDAFGFIRRSIVEGVLFESNQLPALFGHV